MITAFGGGLWWLAHDEVTAAARNERLPDGRPRLPDGQRVLRALKPMGGQPGSPSPRDFQLKLHGHVARPAHVSFTDLIAMPWTETACDIHCVTGWSVLDAVFRGVRVADLADLCGMRASTRHVIFEGAFGYTANVPVDEALAPDVRVAYRLGGRPLGRAHGAPARAVVPSLYFWKSAKWLRGIRFSEDDQPGYWETRGYHNHGDPWLGERYS